MSEEAEDMARTALHRIETHERECSIRYAAILSNQEEAKDERREMHKENQDGIKQINDRMWVASCGVIMAMLGLITTLILTSPK